MFLPCCHSRLRGGSGSPSLHECEKPYATDFFKGGALADETNEPFRIDHLGPADDVDPVIEENGREGRSRTDHDNVGFFTKY